MKTNNVNLSERIESLTHDLSLYFSENRHDSAVCELADQFKDLQGACVDDYALLAVTMVAHCRVFGNSQVVYNQKVKA